MRNVDKDEHSNNLGSPDVARNPAERQESEGDQPGEKKWAVDLWRVNAYDAKEH